MSLSMTWMSVLIHIPWPTEEEDFTLRGYESAVDCLSFLKCEEKIPGYVKYLLDLSARSDTLRQSLGTILTSGVSDDDELVYSNSAKENNFNSERDDYSNEISDQLLVSVDQLSNNIGVLTNISRGNKQYFMDYIKNQQNNYLHNLSYENSISGDAENLCQNEVNTNIVNVNHYFERVSTLR